MISRQKIIGWILVVVSAAYIAYFLKVRLFTPGPIIEKKEWVQFIGSFITLMRAHQRAHGRNARAPAQGLTELSIEQRRLHDA